jgi:hypothetical protein
MLHLCLFSPSIEEAFVCPHCLLSFILSAEFAVLVRFRFRPGRVLVQGVIDAVCKITTLSGV